MNEPNHNDDTNPIPAAIGKAKERQATIFSRMFWLIPILSFVAIANGFSELGILPNSWQVLFGKVTHKVTGFQPGIMTGGTLLVYWGRRDGWERILRFAHRMSIKPKPAPKPGLKPSPRWAWQTPTQPTLPTAGRRSKPATLPRSPAAGVNSSCRRTVPSVPFHRQAPASDHTVGGGSSLPQRHRPTISLPNNQHREDARPIPDIAVTETIIGIHTAVKAANTPPPNWTTGWSATAPAAPGATRLRPWSRPGTSGSCPGSVLPNRRPNPVTGWLWNTRNWRANSTKSNGTRLIRSRFGVWPKPPVLKRWSSSRECPDWSSGN